MTCSVACCAVRIASSISVRLMVSARESPPVNRPSVAATIRRAASRGLSPAIMPRASSAWIAAWVSALIGHDTAVICCVVRPSIAEICASSTRTTPSCPGGSCAPIIAISPSTPSPIARAASSEIVVPVSSARSSSARPAAARPCCARRDLSIRHQGTSPSSASSSSAASISPATDAHEVAHAAVRVVVWWSRIESRMVCIAASIARTSREIVTTHPGSAPRPPPCPTRTGRTATAAPPGPRRAGTR